MLNLSGDWHFFGSPYRADNGTGPTDVAASSDGGETGSGEIRMTLCQQGTEITGSLVQAIDPWTRQPPVDPEATRASITGRLYRGNDSDATLLELLRENHQGSFRAIFTGIVSKDGAEVHGHVVNSNANTGTFRMHRVL
ncbi:MAG: hypothetical protein ACI8PT_004344 [Gammaproteobacteria bacterium]|jgi:hypothetical protein